MTTSQVIIYAILVLLIMLYVKRWIAQRGLTQYTPAEVSGKMRSSVLLDVRTAGERQHQSIKGSIHIPLHELGTRMKELEKYRNTEIICYCQSGSRSISAAARLSKAGFTVANMKGGIAEWNSSGLR
jgi:rhodanese-related sulfurtransferase